MKVPTRLSFDKLKFLILKQSMHYISILNIFQLNFQRYVFWLILRNIFMFEIYNDSEERKSWLYLSVSLKYPVIDQRLTN